MDYKAYFVVLCRSTASYHCTPMGASQFDVSPVLPQLSPLILILDRQGDTAWGIEVIKVRHRHFSKPC